MLSSSSASLQTNPDYSNCTIIHRDCSNDDDDGGVKAVKKREILDCWSVDGFVRPENVG
ncbi:hypothetical protein F2Q70_00002377 [Brassica cretica]|uniref:Uncharacterized protein n=1 Tax=Brassica cretica TaxID=69181 RepID=A0A8S9IK62_BRACR|nr:hypothetical protein F2Q70_00002377 [Brassica cretica]